VPGVVGAVTAIDIRLPGLGTVSAEMSFIRSSSAPSVTLYGWTNALAPSRERIVAVQGFCRLSSAMTKFDAPRAPNCPMFQTGVSLGRNRRIGFICPLTRFCHPSVEPAP
jgi:hypothetical protein